MSPFVTIIPRQSPKGIDPLFAGVLRDDATKHYDLVQIEANKVDPKTVAYLVDRYLLGSPPEFLYRISGSDRWFPTIEEAAIHGVNWPILGYRDATAMTYHPVAKEMLSAILNIIKSLGLFMLDDSNWWLDTLTRIRKKYTTEPSRTLVHPILNAGLKTNFGIRHSNLYLIYYLPTMVVMGEALSLDQAEFIGGALNELVQQYRLNFHATAYIAHHALSRLLPPNLILDGEQFHYI